MYKIPVRVGGKNLFNIKDIIFNGPSLYVKDFVMHENGFSFVRTSTNKTSSVYVDMYFEKGIYAIDGEIVQTDEKKGGYGIYDLEQQIYLVNDSDKGIYTKTFFIPESKTYRLLFFCNYLSKENTKVTFSNIILTKKYNLIDVSKYYNKYLNENGEMSYTEQDFANIKKIEIPVSTEEGKVYKYSCDYEIYSSNTENQTGNGISLQMLDENKKVIAVKNLTSKGQKISGTASISNNSQNKVAYVIMSYITDTRDCTVRLKNIYVTENTENIDYVSYQEPRIYNIYLKEPLRKVEGAEDYIDFNDKKVVRRVGTISINGTENWVRNTVYSTDDMLVGQLRIADMKSGTRSVISNRFRYALPTIINSTRAAAKYLFIAMSTSEIKDVSKLKEWLNQNNVNAFYELENEMEESIKLPNISTQKGGTTISVVGENGVSASNIEVEY